MSENWQYQLQADYLKKILHTYCLPFVAILYSCSRILTKGFPIINAGSKLQSHIMLLQYHASETLHVVCSMDSKCREESARLLGCLIRSCARLILPYIAPIHKVSKI